MNASEAWIHPFETAGLGKAPFVVTGITKKLMPYSAKPSSSCDYCGTAIAYEFWIESSDSRAFKVGCDCVAKTYRDAPTTDRAKVLRAVRKLRKDHDAKERQAARREAQSAASKAPVDATPDLGELLSLDDATTKDIASFFERTGKITERQINFLRTIRDRLARKAEYDARKGTCQVGTVSGMWTVISVKDVDSQYGTVTKFLVEAKAADGPYRVFCAVPISLREANYNLKTKAYDRGDPYDDSWLAYGRGAVIEMTVDVTASRDDKSFGFGKRPRKAKIVTVAPRKDKAIA